MSRPLLDAIAEMEARFRAYLATCNDKQVLAALEKERRYGLPNLAKIAAEEAATRGLPH